MRRKALRSFLARFRWGGFPLRFDEGGNVAFGFVAAAGFEQSDFRFERGNRLLRRFENFGLFFYQRNKLVFRERGQRSHNFLHGRTSRKYAPI